MIGKLNESIWISASRFANDFASFDGPDLAEEGQDQVLSDREVQVADVKCFGPTRVDVTGIHHPYCAFASSNLSSICKKICKWDLKTYVLCACKSNEIKNIIFDIKLRFKNDSKFEDDDLNLKLTGYEYRNPPQPKIFLVTSARQIMERNQNCISFLRIRILFIALHS